MRTYTRENDVVIRIDVKTFPAIVDFRDILGSVEVCPDEYADLSEEIALNVASEMQAAGFDVVNLPDRCHLYRQNRRGTYRRNVHLFDWS